MPILVVHALAVHGALPTIYFQKVSYTLHIVSKSILYSLCSVNKCLMDSLSVLFEVVLQRAPGPALAPLPVSPDTRQARTGEDEGKKKKRDT